MKKIISLALVFAVQSVVALDFDPEQLYFGGAIGKSSVDDIKVEGTQKIITVGYPLDYEVAEFEISAEVQYVKYDDDSGQFFGAVGLRELSFLDNLSGIVRLGLATGGDDTELQFGGGAEYSVNDNFSARSEYLFAGDLETYTLGVVYRR